jgi:hypothetical protein
MRRVGFEPTIPASARQQTYALDRAVGGIGCFLNSRIENNTTELLENLKPHHLNHNN